MITIKNLSKTYQNKQIGITNVNLELPTRGLVVITGQSGSGKSTLLNTLSGLDSYTTGEIRVNDILVKDLSDYATVIFQEMNLIEDFSVYENITFSLNSGGTADGVDEILKKLGILDIKNAHVNQISGGQRQRVAIARALIKDSQVIFCDEPTASLDETNAKELFSILKQLANDKLIIVVTHQDKLALNYTSNIIKIENNEIVFTNINKVNDETSLTVVTKQSLNNKPATKMALKNIKQNKVKTIMTFLFLTISISALAFLTTILAVDLDKVTYDSFINTNQEFVQFNRTYDYRFDGNKSGNISSEVLSQITPDLICYDNINYKLIYQEQSTYIHSVWVSQNNLAFGKTINDDEVLISADIANNISNDQQSLINTYFSSGNANLKIIGILPSSIEDTIIMNDKTFLGQNGNFLFESTIRIRINELSKSGLPVFNPQLEWGFNNNDLVKGALPQAINEVCVTSSLLESLYPNSSAEQLIGTNITLTLINEANQTDTDYTFKLTGISVNHIIFADQQIEFFISNFGTGRINAGILGVIYLDFDLNTFITATNLLIFPQGAVRGQINMAYSILLGFKDILIALAIITLIIAVITILNSVATTILKAKKDLGVLISFNIKIKSLSKIFLIENILVFLLSVVVATAGYGFLVNFLNTKIYEEWHLSVTLLRFEIFLYLVILTALLVLIVMVVSLALIKLVRKRPIDIIYNR